MYISLILLCRKMEVLACKWSLVVEEAKQGEVERVVKEEEAPFYEVGRPFYILLSLYGSGEALCHLFYFLFDTHSMHHTTFSV